MGDQTGLHSHGDSNDVSREERQAVRGNRRCCGRWWRWGQRPRKRYARSAESGTGGLRLAVKESGNPLPLGSPVSAIRSRLLSALERHLLRALTAATAGFHRELELIAGKSALIVLFEFAFVTQVTNDFEHDVAAVEHAFGDLHRAPAASLDGAREFVPVGLESQSLGLRTLSALNFGRPFAINACAQRHQASKCQERNKPCETIHNFSCFRIRSAEFPPPVMMTACLDRLQREAVGKRSLLQQRN